MMNPRDVARGIVDYAKGYAEATHDYWKAVENRLTEALQSARNEALREAAKIAEDGQSNTKSLIAYDDNGKSNAFNTCLKISEAILKLMKENK